MNAQYEEYINFLVKYRDELSSFLENEREKRRALLDSDLNRLGEMLKVQQAESMKFRNLESGRLRLQAQLGLPDEKAGELIKTIGDIETRGRIEALFDEITEIAGLIREQNRQSLELAAISLKAFDAWRPGGEGEANNKVYGPHGKDREAHSPGRAFEETI